AEPEPAPAPPPVESKPAPPAPAAAPPVSSPAPQPQTRDSAPAVRAQWEQIKQAAKDRKKTVAAYLMEATLSEVDGNTLVLSFKHSFHANALQSSDSMKVFVDAASSVLGGEWKVRCVVDEAAAAERARPAPPPEIPKPAAPVSPPPAPPRPVATEADGFPTQPPDDPYDEPPDEPPEISEEVGGSGRAAAGGGSVSMEQAVGIFADKTGAKRL
ncbi:MAG: DNA polymerase III subunit gamma and tau, partial [Stackebrandtia sp.]